MYECSRCERSFTCKRDWKHHTDERQTVCRKPTHYCNRCSKGLSSYRSLWNHKQRCQSDFKSTLSSGKIDQSDYPIRERSPLQKRSVSKEKISINIQDNIPSAREELSIYKLEDKLAELRGKFLFPEESVVWRKVYTEGADPYKVLKEVQKITSRSPIEASHLQMQPPTSNAPEASQRNLAIIQQTKVQGEVAKNKYPQIEQQEPGARDCMRMYELDIPIDKGLTNIELEDYARRLGINRFRGVFKIDGLPNRPHKQECGIVNLPGEPSHWVCYYKYGKRRFYFDSFGRKTPPELQKYLKTKQEYETGAGVIQRSTDIVQCRGTHVCGQLCLYVLRSLCEA